nr:hypothetical protein [uncultured Celeribacter sp.]
MTVQANMAFDRGIGTCESSVELVHVARPCLMDDIPEFCGQSGGARVVQTPHWNRRGKRRDRRVEIVRLRQAEARGHRDVIALGTSAGQMRDQHPAAEGPARHGDMDVVAISVAVAHGDPRGSEWIDIHQLQLEGRDHVPLGTACLDSFRQRQRDMQVTRTSRDALEPLSQIMAPCPGDGAADQL